MCNDFLQDANSVARQYNDVTLDVICKNIHQRRFFTLYKYKDTIPNI